MKQPYKVGDKVKVIRGGPTKLQVNSEWIVEKCFVEDGFPYVKLLDYPLERYSLGGWDVDRFELIEEKGMKREDKVNIEITLQEAAWLYVISARANGHVGYSLYKTFKSMVDPDGVAYDKHASGKFDLIDYKGIQEEFEKAIFDRKTPEQIQLDVLKGKIAELTREADKLQGLINK